ncbi:target of rapamycin complex 2 subunit MAPKAP1/AVO1, partial [Phenoliferia sp. Uapishka_3]
APPPLPTSNSFGNNFNPTPASAPAPTPVQAPSQAQRPPRDDGKHAHLANLLAGGREDGLDTFGNIGNMRVPVGAQFAQRTGMSAQPTGAKPNPFMQQQPKEQSLRLNYIRHVLPNHAAQSSIPGTGPYNLISFDPASPILSSPYVIASGLADEPAWPELSSGRSSPPLGLARGRSTMDATTGSNRRRAGGPGALQYSQTIGKGVPLAGMRVGGRARSWKGRGASQLDASNAEGSDISESVMEQETVPPAAMSRRKSLEMSIHYKRMGVGAENIALPTPPPVVIHSPVRSPQDSPVAEVHSERPSDSVNHSFGAMSRAFGTQDFTHDISEEIASSNGSSYGRADHLHATDPSDSEDDDRFDESPLDFPQPLSHVSENEELSASDLSPIIFGESIPQSHSSASGEVALASSLVSSQSASSLGQNESLPMDVGDRFASVASSGVSLFGVSRLTGAGLGRDRSDSETPLSVPVLDTQVHTIEEDAENDERETLPMEPPTPPPPQARFRPTRERRRVNISGRMLVPITEPVNEEEHSVHVPTPATQAETMGEVLTRARSNTDPEPLAVPSGTKVESTVEPPQAESPGRLHRKASAPSLLGPITASPSSATLSPQQPTVSHPKPDTLSPPTPTTPHRSHSQHSITFPSRATSTYKPPPLPQRSALSTLLSSMSDSPSASNPFSALYAALASRATDALTLSIYFPHSKTPSKALRVNVKKDLSVEEVIGAGLWSYWEEGREPKLEVDEDDPEHDETTKWNLRIVEDDGEVDEDFPALDRTRAISAFSFDEFAIVKAAPQQIKDNQAKQATIQRRPSRVLAPQKRSNTTLAPPPMPGFQPPAQPLAATSTASLLVPSSIAPASSFPPATVGVSSALAVPVLLKVRLPPAPGVETINTTINVPSDMYMSDVLDHICRKRGIENPKDWALVVENNGQEIVVPLDRTVNSLGDRHDLTLVKRSQISSFRDQSRSAHVRTNVNPSGALFSLLFGLRQKWLINPITASIFKRLSEPPQPKYQSATDITSTYQRYTVQRKLPMPLGRHPRTIAIDGDYIHFMPSDSKGMLSGGRTSSFHISNVHECKVSRRSPSSFKLLVQKDRVDKRYDFEAESPKAAAEIVAHIRSLMAAFYQDQVTRAGR